MMRFRQNALGISLLMSGLVVWGGCGSTPVEQIAPSDVEYISGTEVETYKQTGKAVADSVGNLLKSNLMRAMAEGTPSGAVQFCNANALSLTTNLDERYNSITKRTSHKLRNPVNAPSELESKVIANYQADIMAARPPAPKVAIDKQGRKVFFSPIFTGGPCLVCHGDEANMDETLRAKLTELYPDDKAKGFNIDDLRGIWSITFENI